jgi:hypothetical protein
MANFTVDTIQQLSTIKDINELKEAVNMLLDNAKTMDRTRIAVLKKNVAESRTVVNIISMLWNMQLSGEGMSVSGSRYQKNFKKSA